MLESRFIKVAIFKFLKTFFFTERLRMIAFQLQMSDYSKRLFINKNSRE